MKLLKDSVQNIASLVFPSLCAGCNRALFEQEAEICAICLHQLPYTNMELESNNFFEKKLSGRIQLDFAIALLHFYKGSVTQRILHAIKYDGKQQLALEMGKLFGRRLLESGTLKSEQILVPVPLHPHKLQIRGFNQSEQIGRGISQITGLPVNTGTLMREKHHISQTKKGKDARWQEIKTDFHIVNNQLHEKDVILVDDVCTTGATVEVCANALQSSGIAGLSLLTLAIAGEYYE